MLKTVKNYILNLGNQSFDEFWVDYIISMDKYLHELEIKSISEKDLTIENLQKELFELGKELSK
jgi:hypothetical protein